MAEDAKCRSVLYAVVSFSLLSFTAGVVRFTRFPPSDVYVQAGNNATFDWEYYVDNRLAEFGVASPIWEYYNETQSTWIEIANEAVDKSWNWTISAKCPPSLKPRLKKLFNATIQILNVTLSDAGRYRCKLDLSVGSTLIKETTLNVTEETTTTAAPFTTPSSTSTMSPRTFPPVLNSGSFKVKEVCSGEKTKIECPATGSPPPRYSWYNPFNKSVGGKNGVENEIEVDPIEGNWTCHVTNGVGPDVYCIVEIKVLPEGHVECVECNLSTGQMVGIVIGVLLAVIIIAVIVVVIYKKMKSGEGLSTKEMVAIITGMLVAVGIIVAIAVAIHTKNDQCLSTGALVGIIIGVLFVVVGIIVAIVVTVKKKNG